MNVTLPPLSVTLPIAMSGIGPGLAGAAARARVWVSWVMEQPAWPGSATRSMTLSRPSALSSTRP
ncbi:Uncharacterised protein [Bordetella pertussis]|nr:Uncharacterised protein [Bordetella pertussis]CFO29330.1 Uncharacterised protein [Bordetella pertussis]CPK41805.1 Uncharacterised protein [Bordetella pertussis]CPP04628.1 Uncharacterised protein [Bordetella pertussis]CRE24058.1 Uncharacterised protein [Bordetella pertussis]